MFGSILDSGHVVLEEDVVVPVDAIISVSGDVQKVDEVVQRSRNFSIGEGHQSVICEAVLKLHVCRKENKKYAHIIGSRESLSSLPPNWVDVCPKSEKTFLGEINWE